jgi:hypothetical protein
MQTFLPYANFAESAAVLDRQRLGKQRVETLQILRALAGFTKGWVNHPATRMWRNHAYALGEYGIAVCNEWRRRGYEDNCEIKIRYLRSIVEGESSLPSWLGDDAVHRSHRSNLIRKNPSYYGPLFPDTPDNLPYLWP